MSKIELSENQEVTDLAGSAGEYPAHINEASGWAKAIWSAVCSQTGLKQDTALPLAAREAKVTPNTIWKLRYRKPRKLDHGDYLNIKAAFDRLDNSVENKIAQNLALLRSLPATPHRDRLVAGMEEYLRNSQSAEARATAQSTPEGSE